MPCSFRESKSKSCARFSTPAESGYVNVTWFFAASASLTAQHRLAHIPPLLYPLPIIATALCSPFLSKYHPNLVVIRLQGHSMSAQSKRVLLGWDPLLIISQASRLLHCALRTPQAVLDRVSASNAPSDPVTSYTATIVGLCRAQCPRI